MLCIHSDYREVVKWGDSYKNSNEMTALYVAFKTTGKLRAGELSNKCEQ
jgi:hypothetical protein